ncbi:hypothetical protein BPJM79_30444 [Bacillus pumilus]
MRENDHISSHRFLIFFFFFYHFSSLSLRTHERKGGQAGAYVTYKKIGSWQNGIKIRTDSSAQFKIRTRETL